MKYLNAAKGLGDAIYLRAVVLHLLAQGETLTVVTGWPDVFSDLPVTVKPLSSATGDEDWHHAKPCLHCRIITDVDQFAMACRQAGITEPVELRMNWRVKNTDLVARIKREAAGRKVFVYQPLKKASNVNQDLARPQWGAFRKVVEKHADHFRVRLGHPAHLDDTPAPCELDLFGKTSVTDAFDIATIADVFFGEPCYLFILAQAMNKPSISMFSGRGADSGRHRIVNFSPERLFHKRHLTSAIYDDERVPCAS